MDAFSDFIRDSVNASENVAQKIVLTVAIILIAFAFRKSVRWLISRFTESEKVIRRVSRLAVYIVGIAGTIAVFLVWFNALDTFIILALIAGVVVVLAMQTLVINVFASIYIATQSPFKVGDRIEVDGIRGDVESIGLFEFTIQEVSGWLETVTPTGRLIHLPNSTIFEKPFANEADHFPFVWHNITLYITHHSNISKAEEILVSAAERELDRIIATHEDLDREKLSNMTDVFEGEDGPTVAIDITGSGIEMHLRYLTPNRELARTKTALWKYIHARISAVDDIAYSPDSLRVVSSEARSPIE